MKPRKPSLVFSLALAAGLAASVACRDQERSAPSPAEAKAVGRNPGAGAKAQSDPGPTEVPGVPKTGKQDPPPSTDHGTLARKAPPAAAERREERLRMVEDQIGNPRDGRTAIGSKSVLEAMRTVPRHVFVPERYEGEAYADYPLPIGYDQTISQPYIVAWMTELLRLTPKSKVLEVGTGSGYQAAVLAHMTPHVYTVEIVEALAERAQKTLRSQGYTEIECRHADGYHGWKEKAPFDAIIVTCAPEKVPPPLWEQLAPGGRMVIPVGDRFGAQELVVLSKTPEGERKKETISLVRFVPLTRDPSLEAKPIETDAKEPKK